MFGHQRHLTSPIIPAEADTLLGWVDLEISHNGTLLRGYRSLFASLLLIFTGLAFTAIVAVRLSRTINGPMSLIKQAVSQLKDGNPACHRWAAASWTNWPRASTAWRPRCRMRRKNCN